MSMAIFPAQAVLMAVVLPLMLAAISDITSMRIGNAIVAALLVAYVSFAFVFPVSLQVVLGSVAAALVVFMSGFLMFCRGWIGGGDVKFAAVIVLWVGTAHAVDFLIYTSLLGGVLTLIILKFRAMPLPAALINVRWLSRLHAHNRIPYGAALAGGAILVLPNTSFIAPLVATTT